MESNRGNNSSPHWVIIINISYTFIYLNMYVKNMPAISFYTNDLDSHMPQYIPYEITPRCPVILLGNNSIFNK